MIPQGTPISVAIKIEKSVRKKSGLGALEQRLRYRSLEEDGLTQIAVDQLAQPVGELHRQRLVESIGCPQLRNVGRGRLIAQHDRRRIPRRKSRDEKDERGHQQHHDRHAGEPRGEIAGHSVRLQPNLPLNRWLATSCEPHFWSPVFQKNGHGIAT